MSQLTSLDVHQKKYHFILLLIVAGLIALIFYLIKLLIPTPPENQKWAKTAVLLFNRNMNERQYMLSHLSIAPKPDILFLGSSRIMQIDSNMFNPEISVFSSGVSVATIPDIIAFWQHMKNQNKIPSYVVIFIDPWHFNNNNKQTNWKINQALYDQFIFGKTSTNPPTSNYFSKAVYKNESDFPANQEGRRFDGSVLYPTQFTKVKTSVEINLEAKKYMEGCVFCLCEWDFDEKRYQELLKLVKDIHLKGTKILVVLPPYQHQVYNDILKSKTYKKILPQVVETLGNRLIKETEEKFSFCNAIDPASVGCSETEFIDGMHYQRSCAEKIIKKCFVNFEQTLLE